MPASSLDVRGLSAGYDASRVLDGVSFSIGAGERIAVLGRNGVGKTTLLATLMGLTTYQGGSVAFGGREITNLGTAGRAALGLGYVPQTRDIFQSLTVEENLLTGLKSRPASAIEEAYELFPRLRERWRNQATLLSGGEQQMLSMARALLGKPSLLLLDEPLEGLAPVICDELMATLSALAQAGEMTIVLVEQQIDRALLFANRTFILDRGRVVWEGASSALDTDRDVVENLIGIRIRIREADPSRPTPTV